MGAEEARFKKIETEMRLKKAEEDEFENLRNMLWEEETENRLRQQERNKQDMIDRTKQEMIMANHQQKMFKEEIRRQEQADEEQLRMQVQEKFRADHQLDKEARILRAQQ